MKVTCDNCGMGYRIPVERLTKPVNYATCKSCKTRIIIRRPEPMPGAGAAGGSEGTDGAGTPGFAGEEHTVVAQVPELAEFNATPQLEFRPQAGDSNRAGLSRGAFPASGRPAIAPEVEAPPRLGQAASSAFRTLEKNGSDDIPSLLPGAEVAGKAPEVRNAAGRAGAGRVAGSSDAKMAVESPYAKMAAAGMSGAASAHAIGAAEEAKGRLSARFSPTASQTPPPPPRVRSPRTTAPKLQPVSIHSMSTEQSGASDEKHSASTRAFGKSHEEERGAQKAGQAKTSPARRDGKASSTKKWGVKSTGSSSDGLFGELRGRETLVSRQPTSRLMFVFLGGALLGLMSFLDHAIWGLTRLSAVAFIVALYCLISLLLVHSEIAKKGSIDVAKIALLPSVTCAVILAGLFVYQADQIEFIRQDGVGEFAKEWAEKVEAPTIAPNTKVASSRRHSGRREELDLSHLEAPEENVAEAELKGDTGNFLFGLFGSDSGDASVGQTVGVPTAHAPVARPRGLQSAGSGASHLDVEKVNEVIKQARLDSCLLDGRSTLAGKGRVEVNLRIAPDGSVESVKLGESVLRGSRLDVCLRGKLSVRKFPPFDAKTGEWYQYVLVTHSM